MKNLDKIITATTASCFICLSSMNSTLADEARTTLVNWNDLNLSPEQSTSIQTLNTEWNHQYMELKPEIEEEQKKLTSMLGEPNSDPLEIISLQSSIEHKRGQLKTVAINNYLHKRQILNAEQRKRLHNMVRNAIVERQKQNAASSNADPMSDRIQSLMKQIQNIFPSN